MRTKKPDWAQRMVQRHVGVEDSEPENYRAVMLPAKQVETLLRAHHRRVVRMVRGLQRLEMSNTNATWSGYLNYNRACKDIRDKLEEMTGRKRDASV